MEETELTEIEGRARAAQPLKLADRVELLLELLDESLGEVTPEIEGLFESIAAKAESYGHAYKRLKGEAGEIKKLADYYAQRGKAKLAAAERLREHLQVQLERAGMPHVPTPTMDVKLQPSPEALVIHCSEADIPAQYKTETITYPVSKDALRDAIVNGTIELMPDPADPTRKVPIATLEARQHVRFR